VWTSLLLSLPPWGGGGCVITLCISLYLMYIPCLLMANEMGLSASEYCCLLRIFNANRYAHAPIGDRYYIFSLSNAYEVPCESWWMRCAIDTFGSKWTFCITISIMLCMRHDFERRKHNKDGGSAHRHRRSQRLL
jgi:hypothetical protein